jgi:hypothetical protein
MVSGVLIPARRLISFSPGEAPERRYARGDSSRESSVYVLGLTQLGSGREAAFKTGSGALQEQASSFLLRSATMLARYDLASVAAIRQYVVHGVRCCSDMTTGRSEVIADET